MIKTTKTTTELNWDLPGSGLMKAVIENGKVIFLQFTEEHLSQETAFSSTDRKHLANVYKCLGALLEEIDGSKISNTHG